MSEENLYTFENPEFRKTFWHTSSHVMAQAVKRCALTDHQNCDIIYPLKAVTKTRAKVRFSERKPYGERLLLPCFCDTTFEPWVGNVPPGAPVKASMSDGFRSVTRVEPWNT